MAPSTCGTAVTWAPDALPPTLCVRLAGLFGLPTVPDTLAEAADAVTPSAPADRPAVAAALDDGPDAVGAAHEVETATGRAAAPTFGDALALLALDGGPGVVATTDPVTGAGVTVRVGDGLDPAPAEGGEADPADAVVSVGAGPDVRTEAPPATAVRDQVVPHVHAFASRRSYWRFDAATPEPTTVVRPERAGDVGRLLAGAPRSRPPTDRFPVDCEARPVAPAEPSGSARVARLDDAVPGR